MQLYGRNMSSLEYTMIHLFNSRVNRHSSSFTKITNATDKSSKFYQINCRSLLIDFLFLVDNFRRFSATDYFSRSILVVTQMVSSFISRERLCGIDMFEGTNFLCNIEVNSNLWREDGFVTKFPENHVLSGQISCSVLEWSPQVRIYCISDKISISCSDRFLSPK